MEKKYEIIEVGPRDGFQNVKDFIETEDKVKIIKKLIDSGIKDIEITSFVHPKWIPQMRDAVEVVAEIKEYIVDKDVNLMALIPNKKGAIRAKEAGINSITYVISASETHNKNNVNKTVSESFLELEEIISEVKDIDIRLGIATTFGCPFGEEITSQKVINIAEKALKLGVSGILLADTIGVASPLQIESMLNDVAKSIDKKLCTLHIHDTRGLGIANYLTAMQLGYTRFETSIGGLGGCPFAPGAAGNVGTEDLIYMLDKMEIGTGIDIATISEAIKLVDELVSDKPSSHMSKILK